MSWNFELVAGPYGGTTEGPVWDGEALLFTHIPANRILRYDPESGETTEYFNMRLAGYRHCGDCVFGQPAGRLSSGRLGSQATG